MSPIDGWWRALRGPLAAFVVLAAVFATTDADACIARWLFFDADTGRWLGAHSAWTNAVLHTGGGWLVRSVVVAVLSMWIATFIAEPVRHWRRTAAYFLIAVLLSVGIVGVLKHFTNVDCPWDLLSFGGRFPYVPLFSDRPDALRAAHCFPAAHAGSGYALMALYFVFRDVDRRKARAGFAASMATGLIFGFAQQSRGAHFLSHDLWSAMIAWSVCAGVYWLGFRGSLRATADAPMPEERALITMP
ncbi:MAG TPA: phosphatase PAP2 family protein [Povalibacter sp.]|uniref:phosphatase PAP2 family protein n=1 Tax=Povalibacter sp. TaxID=1962978 RepID=UPI002BEFFBC1|nr:phosphatase PAP2 family protein [Povalibacter sp.]HMN44875.1 phosphatase PAP2 family protein [Povalibacter sp.]